MKNNLSYYDLVKMSQQSKTAGGEERMWKSVQHISNFLEELNEVHPLAYSQFMEIEKQIMGIK